MELFRVLVFPPFLLTGNRTIGQCSGRRLFVVDAPLSLAGGNSLRAGNVGGGFDLLLNSLRNIMSKTPCEV